ncbi:hypothetical protein GCM10017687_14760 [Streptomyces echinatus]
MAGRHAGRKTGDGWAVRGRDAGGGRAGWGREAGPCGGGGTPAVSEPRLERKSGGERALRGRKVVTAG